MTSEHLAKAEEVLGFKYEIPPTWLSVVDGVGELLAIMIYHNASQCNCEITCVTFKPCPLSRKVYRDLFAYPFLQCGFRRLSAVVKVSNSRSLDCTRRLGFSVEGLLRNWYPDCDGILFSMLKEECKWLK
jgi:hypothetical protein